MALFRKVAVAAFLLFSLSKVSSFLNGPNPLNEKCRLILPFTPKKMGTGVARTSLLHEYSAVRLV